MYGCVVMAGWRDESRQLTVPPQLSSDGFSSDDVVHLADSSSSLGLISTLVFGIAVDNAMQMDNHTHNWTILFLALAVAFSVFTTTYSLLEYFYIKLACRVVGGMGSSPPWAARAAMALLPTEDRRTGMTEQLASVLESFDDMRLWCVNSMWCSLMTIIAAMISKLDPVIRVEGKPQATSSTKTAIWFLVVLTPLSMSFAYGFRSKDIKAYMLSCIVGFVFSLVAAACVGSWLPTARIVASCILVVGIWTVPVTVRSFRLAYGPILGRHCGQFLGHRV